MRERERERIAVVRERENTNIKSNVFPYISTCKGCGNVLYCDNDFAISMLFAVENSNRLKPEKSLDIRCEKREKCISCDFTVLAKSYYSYKNKYAIIILKRTKDNFSGFFSF